LVKNDKYLEVEKRPTVSANEVVLVKYLRRKKQKNVIVRWLEFKEGK